ncbi:ABC transporter permease [Bacteroidota bacterium]
MSTISLIIRREYLTRVRKRSFIIMSILGPVLFAALMVVPAMLATMEDKEVKQIAVIDETTILTYYSAGAAKSVIEDTEYIKFISLENADLETLKAEFSSSGYYAILYIPSNIINSEKAILYSDRQSSLEVSSYIKNKLEQEIEGMKLVAHDIENLEEILNDIKTSIKVSSIKWTKDGESKQSNTGVVMGIGYAAGFMIYMFIFMYGAMVMRGVIEEKTSRIVEVIVSSVKPFQLMMGKIVGIGLVGLTQFLIWIILTIVLVFGASTFIAGELRPSNPSAQIQETELFSNEAVGSTIVDTSNTDDELLTEIISTFGSVNIFSILGAFLFYFLFGFLLYASLFAVVGSAVDNETETQQFMLPVTIPLILGIVLMANVMNNPDGPLAFWFSIFPLTSPIVMMVRMPFEVPLWELLLSGGLLILTILGVIWMAGKIYRVGILMYGKKVTYSELVKWLKYKN